MAHHGEGVCHTPDIMVKCGSFYVFLPLFSNMADKGALRDSEL